MNLSRLALPIGLVGGIILLALAAPILPLADPVRMDVSARLTPPSLDHWLGQDEYGRDVLSRIIWGARASLAVAFVSALAAGLAGIFIGLVGGYFRGVVEFVTVRVAEAVLCFPPLLLALLVVTLVGPGIGTLIFALSILYAPGFARVAYGQTLSIGALDYVTAQRALGAGAWRILARTILPNAAPPLLVQLSITVAAAMVLESGLSFLGLGVVPPSPSWGLMIRGARSTMAQAPWLLLWPSLALCVTVISLNLLCDRLRQALDPGAMAGSWISRLVPLRPRSGRETIRPGPPVGAQPDVGDRRQRHSTGARRVAGSGARRDAGPGRRERVRQDADRPRPARPAAASHPRDRRRDPVHRPPGHHARHVEPRRGGLAPLRGNEIAMVFQDATASLNPVLRIGLQLTETLRTHQSLSRSAARARAEALLGQVGLPDPAGRLNAFPHELSGGQRQRAMIAIAIANGPRLLVADEPTTALDPTIQAQILDLLAELKAQAGGMGLLFVSHNLAVVAEIATRVAVMYAGEIVEQGPAAEIFANPRHPYTAALIASAPEGGAERLVAIPGVVPPPHDLPPGCRFAPRCALKVDRCDDAPPSLIAVGTDHFARCPQVVS